MSKKKIFFITVFSLAFVFSMTGGRARADEFGCQGSTGCKNITASANGNLTAFEVAKFQCEKFETCSSLNIGTGCRGLGVTCPVASPSQTTVNLRSYHCFTIKDTPGGLSAGKCVDISDVDEKSAFAQARTVCAVGANATEADKVKLETGKCPLTTGAGGASVDDLQTQAAGLNKLGVSDVAGLVGRFIQILMAFIGSITLVLYVYAGILWMTASGASERVETAKKILVWTTLGVAVMLSSYVLASFLFKSLGL